MLPTPTNKTLINIDFSGEEEKKEEIGIKRVHCLCISVSLCMFIIELLMEKKMSKILMAEGLVRILAMVLAAVAATLVGLDAETKKVMFMERRAHVKDLPALWVLTIIAAVAACYQFLQLCRCLALAWTAKNPCDGSKFFSWVCLLFDQGVTYVTFAASMAAAQGSLVALTGVKALQWEKLCNIYTKFCVQVAAGVAVGLLASAAMAVVSSVSAYRLFRLYPSDPRPFSHVARRWSLS